MTLHEQLNYAQFSKQKYLRQKSAGHAGLKAVMPSEPTAGPAKLSMTLVCEAITEGCKAALAAASDCMPLICGVSVEPSQAPVTLVILLGDDELQAKVMAIHQIHCCIDHGQGHAHGLGDRFYRFLTPTLGCVESTGSSQCHKRMHVLLH